ncbi:MAG: CDP-alcohol phosphatidyltransferase family protein [Proteobacteria bacterium]|nr:CDP-alcohol phosphatidyltransferase family protein [Pseudomonadota bacterium]MDA1324458.1 CDP-alcohol phosphatidyltransferase family protein [Pseudomonadota bacterium]
MNLPNIISLGRLLSVPVAIYLILNGFMTAAFWLFIAAGISDGVDGYLAKALGQSSALGAYLDPIADKVLLVGVYLTLGHAGHLPTWLVIMVVFRDLIIVGGILLLHISTNGVRMKPLLVSKVNTAAQITLIALVLAELGLNFDLGGYLDVLVYVVGVTTLASGASYIINWGRTVVPVEDN